MRKLLLLLTLLTAGLAGQTVTIAENLLDSQGGNLRGVLDISNAAMLLPTGSTCTVTNATNATPIQIDCSASHGFSTGYTVYVVGISSPTAANGTWQITVVDADSFTLNGSVGNGAYGTGGTAQRRINIGAKHQRYPAACTITGATNVNPIEITCSAAHNYVTGAQMTVSGVLGNTAANGTWTITVTASDKFTVPTTGNGAYTSGGTASGTFVGGVSIPLYPTTTAEATPGGGAAGFTYTVTYILTDGSRYSEQWNIAPTPTSNTVSAVRAPGVQSATATVNLTQISASGADGTRNRKLTWTGSQPAWYLQDYVINAQTGTSYTVLDEDRQKTIRLSNTSAIAVTLPQAGASSQFTTGWQAKFCSDNAGEVTITPTTSTIDGQATLKLRVGMCTIVESDGVNYFSTGPNPGTAGANFANILRLLASSTADGTVANTASETTLIGTVSGSKTLPANFHDAAGSTLRVHAEGYYSNTGTPTLTIKLKYGSTVLASTGAVTTTTGATTWQWFFDGWVTCRTTGSSGTAMMQGRLLIQTGTNTVSVYPMLNTSTVTINTTTTNAVDLTAQWGAGDPANTIRSTNFHMFPVTTPL